MVINNIKELLIKWLNKKNKTEIVLKSIIYSCIVDTFYNEKKIDIKPYLISIKILWDSLIITTNKPIINNEISLYEEKIKKLLKNKLKNIWINYVNYNFKYK